MATVDLLTHKKIQGLSAGENRERFYEKAFSPGSFGVEVSPRTGRKSFFVVCQDANGNRKRKTVGYFASDDPDGIRLREARKQARTFVVETRKQDSSEDQSNVNPDDTLGNLVEQFFNTHCSTLSEETVRSYRQRLEKDIIPRWQEHPPDDITKADVNDVLDHIAFEREAPIASDRTRAVLQVFYNWARKRDLVETNPVSETPKRADESPRERVLSGEEINTFWNAT